MRLASFVELVTVNVSNEAEPNMIIGMVEDETVVLALGRAQTTTDHLNEQHFALGGARQDDATNAHPVHAGGEGSDVADDFDLTFMEAIGDEFSIGLAGETIDVFGAVSRRNAPTTDRNTDGAPAQPSGAQPASSRKGAT
jgi:hypothetical protein